MEPDGKWQECPGVDFEDDLFLLNEQEQEKDRNGSLNISAAELRELQNKD